MTPGCRNGASSSTRSTSRELRTHRREHVLIPGAASSASKAASIAKSRRATVDDRQRDPDVGRQRNRHARGDLEERARVAHFVGQREIVVVRDHFHLFPHQLREVDEMQAVVLLETNPRDQQIVRAGHQTIACRFEPCDGIDGGAPFDRSNERAANGCVRFNDQNAFGAREASRLDAQMLIGNMSRRT